MQISASPSWVSAQDCGKELVVTKVTNVSQGTKPDYEIHMDTPEKSTVRMSLWGPNLVYMVNVFGNETDKWIGQKVKVEEHVREVNGKAKRIRVLSAFRGA